jgi:uncharacterized protein YcfJ
MRTRSFKATLLATAVAMSMAGCYSPSRINDGDVDEGEGQAVGAAVGAVAGHEIEGGALGTVIGAVVGGMIGGEIAENELSNDFTGDDTVAVRTESGETVYVKPVDRFDRDGKPCREYELRTQDGGRTERAVACENSPGNWRLASAE